MIRVSCVKCDGSGYIKAFDHVVGGVCFSCSGKGYRMMKREPVPSKSYSFSFLWTDPESPNYKNGEFCRCFYKKAKSEKAAEKIAIKAMKNNGAADFKVQEV